MKALFTLASLSVLSLAAGNAMAQSSDTWTGPYVSLYAGEVLDPDDGADQFIFDTNLDGAFGDTVFTAAGANAFSPGSCNGLANGATPAAGCRSNKGGSDLGLKLGYDWQHGPWVFGVVGEYGKSDYRDAVSSFSTTPAFYTMSREIDYTLALRGRAGYTFGDASANLVYVTLGMATAKVENTYTTSNGVNTFTNNGNQDADGSQWGIGYERRVSEQLSLGIEYLASRLEDKDYRVRSAGPAPATNPFILVNAAGTDMRRSDRYLETETIRATAGWRF